MKQTAVEWIQQQLESGLISIEMEKDSPYKYDHWDEIFNQAKLMEKEQIIDAYTQCGVDNFDNIKVINRSAVEYYNETY